MSYILKILDVDKTSLLLAGSLRIVRRTDHRSECSLTIKTTAGSYMPQVGQDIKIMDGVNIVFGGVIDSSPILRPGVGTDDDTDIFIDIASSGYSSIPSRRTISLKYDQVSAGYIVSSLRSTVLNGEGITEGFIETGANPVGNAGEYDAICKSVQTIYDEMAEASGFKWYIDDYKALFFHQDDTVTDAAHELNNLGIFTDFRNIKVTPDMDEYANKVFLRCDIGDDGYEIISIQQDDAEILNRQAAEGGSAYSSGVYGIVLTDTKIHTQVDADAKCLNELKKRSRIPIKLTFDSFTLDWAPATKLKVNLPTYGLSADTYFLIEEVTLQDIDGRTLMASISATRRNENNFSTQRSQSGVDYFSKLVNAVNEKPTTVETTVADGSITTAKLADNAVTTSKIADAQITTAKIIDAQITSAKIGTAQIQEAHIQDAAITNAKILDATITNAKIASATIQTANIANAAITNALIGTAAIKTANIEDAAVTNAKIALATIKTANIEDAAITSAKIASATIQSANIAFAAITTALINTAAITTALIGDAQITNAKIVDATITNAKICLATIFGANIANATITDANIVDATITSAKIANATITFAQIANATIKTANIESGAITTALIATAAIGTTQIADGSITDAKIVTLTANKISAGTIDGSIITVTNLVADNIVAGALTIVPRNEFKGGSFEGVIPPKSELNNGNVVLDTTEAWHESSSLKHISAIDIWDGSNATFARASVATKQDGSQVASGEARYETGQFGQAVMVEEGTTNLLAANQSNVETDTTGFAISQTGTTLTRDTAEHWQGTASLKSVCDGTLDIQGWGTFTKCTDVSASLTYTASVWVKGSGNLTLYFNEWDASSAFIGGTTQAFTATSTWTRHSVTRTFGATGVKASISLTTDGAQAVTFYADGLQLEQKAYATSWHPGSCIPNMTADSTPSPYVVSTSFAQLGGNAAYGAFDGAINTYPMLHSVAGVTTGIINMDLGTAQVVNRYEMICQTTITARAPYTWTFEGSNDNSNWTVLDARTAYIGWVAYTSSFFDFNNSIAYRYYRINVTGANPSNDGYLTLAKIQVYNVRQPETLTIPTAGVFNRGNWTIEMIYEPKCSPISGTYLFIFTLTIDANNVYALLVSTTGRLYLSVRSGGSEITTYSASDAVLQEGQKYHISARGNGSEMALFVNGQLSDSGIKAYVEPVGDLPANMYIGSWGAGYQANGIIDDLRISNIARTDAEILAAYNSGVALLVDDYTTAKLNFDNVANSVANSYFTFSQKFNASPNEHIIVSTRVKSTGAHLVKIYVRWVDINDVIIHQDYSSLDTTTEWQRLYDVFTAPSGSVAFYVGLINYDSNTTIWWDALQVQRGNIITEYVEHTDEQISAGAISEPLLADASVSNRVIQAAVITGDRIVADSITAREIAANTITANEMAVGTITAASGIIASIDASVITSGSISADRISGGTISGVTINVSTDATVGDNLYVGSISIRDLGSIMGFYVSTSQVMRFYNNGLYVNGFVGVPSGSSFGMQSGNYFYTNMIVYQSSTTMSYATTFSSSITVSGTSTFNNTVDFNYAANFDGSVTFNSTVECNNSLFADSDFYHRGSYVKFFNANGSSRRSVGTPDAIVTTNSANSTYGSNEQYMLGYLKTDVTNLRSQLYDLCYALIQYGLIS